MSKINDNEDLSQETQIHFQGGAPETDVVLESVDLETFRDKVLQLGFFQLDYFKPSKLNPSRWNFEALLYDEDTIDRTQCDLLRELCDSTFAAQPYLMSVRRSMRRKPKDEDLTDSIRSVDSAEALLSKQHELMLPAIRYDPESDILLVATHTTYDGQIVDVENGITLRISKVNGIEEAEIQGFAKRFGCSLRKLEKLNDRVPGFRMRHQPLYSLIVREMRKHGKEIR